MEFNSDQLKEIERLAAAAFSPRETAFMLGIAPTEFKNEIANEDSEAAIAYYKGFYSSELAIRESAFLLARSGSSPAQTLALKYFDETKSKIVIDEQN